VPVNAVLILDSLRSMSGVKDDRAREAARALVRALLPEDRLAIVEFSARHRSSFTRRRSRHKARSRAMEAIEELQPVGRHEPGAAFDAAGPELARTRRRARRQGLPAPTAGERRRRRSAGLLRLARRDLPGATLSTFGIGDDYDEDLLSALAAQAGGARVHRLSGDPARAFALS